MVKTLSRVALVLALASSVSALGCAATGASDDEGTDEAVQTAHAALSTKSKIAVVPLDVRATYDAALGTTMVDLTTGRIPNAPTDPDPHNGDQFLAVLVYVDRTDGRRDLLTVVTRQEFTGPNQIGPGGGCIHFRIPALAGDRIAIGAVVRLETETRVRIGAAPVVTVAPGTWQLPTHDH
jgi:hypothetical protein